MRFAILGPLEVWNQRVEAELRGARQQAVLAALLLEPNRRVTVDHLTNVLWEERPPVTATQQIRNTVSALRRTLSAAGGADLIVGRSGGYLLRLDGSGLDAQDFRTLTAEAGRLAVQGQPASASGVLRTALALWRGPALAGIRGHAVETAALRLNEQRLAAQEECLDLELALGLHRRVVDELAALVHQYPLRESFVRQFMIALYRSGRQADALEQYHRTRRRLADELGVDPCGALSRLYLQMLRKAPDLDRSPALIR